MSAVSNSGPLIHLAKIGRLDLLKEIFWEVIVPESVRVEVVERGKEKGEGDAFLIESAGWIRAVEDPPGADSLAERAGIHRGEACAILLARSMNLPVLLDDSGARRFALGLGLRVTGSIGVIIRAVRLGLLSKDEGLESLERIAGIMWLRVDVYERARRIIEEM